MATKATNDVAAVSEAIVAETEARLAISFERTISIQQYEPIKVFGSVSLGSSTPPEQVEALLQVFDQYGTQLAERVVNLAEGRAAELRGSAPAPSPAPRRQAAARKPAARPANGSVNIEGVEFEAFTNRDGAETLKAPCSACGENAYFNAYTNNRTGAEVSAEQSVRNAFKYDGGVFCRNHKPEKGASAPAGRYQNRTTARPRVVQPVIEDDDNPF